MRALLEELEVSLREIGGATVAASMDWLEAYADHQPDFAAAVTVVLLSEIEKNRVWSYDRKG